MLGPRDFSVVPRGVELFFDKMSPLNGGRPRHAAARRARADEVEAPGRAWVQPGLPASSSRRRRTPDGSPALAAAVRVADGLAEARGWSAEVRCRVRKGLGIALASCGEGQDVQWSRVLPLLHAEQVSTRHVAEVLRQAGVLHDDRPPAFDAWLDRKLDGVASGIRHDAERWLRTLKEAC